MGKFRIMLHFFRTFLQGKRWFDFYILITLTDLCLRSRAWSTLGLSSALIWSEMIIVSTIRWMMPGKVFCSRSKRMAPRRGKLSEGPAKLMQSQDCCQMSECLSSTCLPFMFILGSFSNIFFFISAEHRNTKSTRLLQCRSALLHARRNVVPCVMVRRSSSKLRNDREATWGLPQRSVSSSTSSSNLIQRARSFQRISWSFTISSFSSTNS